MYNKLREKVNLLLEDVEVLEDQTSEKPEEKDIEKCPECGKPVDTCECKPAQEDAEKTEEKPAEPETCPECGKPVDDCECQTAQESVKKPKQERTGSFFNTGVKTEFDDYGTDENYVSIAKQILKRQKKLGKLKSVKVQVLSLDESRKKRLKSAGILMGTTIGSSALAATLDYAASKKSVDYLANKKANLGKTNGAVKALHSSLMKDSAKKMGATTAVMGALTTGALAASKNNHELVIICDYKYGKKILPLFSLTEKVNTKKAISTIGSNVAKAVKKLQKAQEWAVKEDFSQLDFNKKFMTELLIESMEE